MKFKKHLAVFESASDYEAFKSSEEFVTPNVSLCRDEYKLHYNAKEEDVYDPFNGHEYVDLGLPSGTLWATKVVGAENEGDYGLYFAWGNVEGATKEGVESGEFTFGTFGNMVKYIDPSTETWTKYNGADGKVVLDLEDDAAHVHMGGDWHMPTKEQLEELKANTTSTWTTQNGVNGRLFTSKVNGNSVFVPAFGYFYASDVYSVGSYGYVWSSSVDEESLNYTWGFGFSSSHLGVYSNSRTRGRIVFGVIG